MRTKTTKEAEKLTFEKLSTWSILIGVTKVLTVRTYRFYKRHEAGVLYLTLFLTYLAVGLHLAK